MVSGTFFCNIHNGRPRLRKEETIFVPVFKEPIGPTGQKLDQHWYTSEKQNKKRRVVQVACSSNSQQCLQNTWICLNLTIGFGWNGAGYLKHLGIDLELPPSPQLHFGTDFPAQFLFLVDIFFLEDLDLLLGYPWTTQVTHGLARQRQLVIQRQLHMEHATTPSNGSERASWYYCKVMMMAEIPHHLGRQKP